MVLLPPAQIPVSSIAAHYCGDELDGSPYVQSEADMLSEPQRFANINCVMAAVLEALDTGAR